MRPNAAGPPPAPLLGRARELEALDAVLERALSGRRAVALVEGEAGIGKSTLLEETGRRAAARGFAVWRGAGEELARDRPFGAIADAVGVDETEALHPELAVALRGAPATGMAPISGRITVLLLEAIAQAAAAAPLLLALDDVQWADHATLGVLDAALRRPEGHRLALVLARRPEPTVPELESFIDRAHRAGATILVLGPLGEDAVDQLAERHTGGRPGPALRRRLAGAAGNPLFVQELLAGLREAGDLRVEVQHVDAAEGAVPASAAAAILRRLAGLPPAERELLGLATVLGSSFDPVDLALLAERSAVEVARLLRTAVRAGFVQAAGDRMSFRHDLVREALYYDMPRALCAALHLQAARALARAGRPPAAVAAQLSRGAGPGDEWAVEWLVRAAQDAVRRAPAIASDLLERALHIAGDLRDRRLEVLVAQVPALVWSGRFEDAVARGQEALELAPAPAQEAAVRLALMRAYLLQDRPEAALPHAEAAEAREDFPAGLHGQLLAEVAWLRLGLADLPAVVAAGGRAVRLGRSVGDGMAVVVAQAALAAEAMMREAADEALELARAAAEAARRDEALRHPAVDTMLAFALVRVDALEDARRVATEALARAQGAGADAEVPDLVAALVSLDFLVGRWDDALERYRQWSALIDRLGQLRAPSGPPGVAAMIAVHRGDLDLAREALEDAERRGREMRLPPTLTARGRALLLEARGQPREAVQHLAEAWTRAEEVVGRGHRRFLAPDLVRLACATGERRLAHEVTEAAVQTAAIGSVHSMHGTALYCRAMLTGDAALFRAAAAEYSAARWPLLEAMSLEGAAAAGEREQAIADLQRSLDAFAGLGAARDVARVAARLRALGVRRGRRGARRRPESGWDALTEAEQKVVALVAQGLSNPEVAQRLFLSRRTVEAHLRTIYRKLEVRSRVELAAAAARRTAAAAAER